MPEYWVLVTVPHVAAGVVVAGAGVVQLKPRQLKVCVTRQRMLQRCAATGILVRIKVLTFARLIISVFVGRFSRDWF